MKTHSPKSGQSWWLGSDRAAPGYSSTGGMCHRRRVGGHMMSFVVTVRKTPFLMAGMRWACCKSPKQNQPEKGRKGVR